MQDASEERINHRFTLGRHEPEHRQRNLLGYGYMSCAVAVGINRIKRTRHDKQVYPGSLVPYFVVYKIYVQRGAGRPFGHVYGSGAQTVLNTFLQRAGGIHAKGKRLLHGTREHYVNIESSAARCHGIFGAAESCLRGKETIVHVGLAGDRRKSGKGTE